MKFLLFSKQTTGHRYVKFLEQSTTAYTINIQFIVKGSRKSERNYRCTKISRWPDVDDFLRSLEKLHTSYGVGSRFDQFFISEFLCKLVI